MSYWLSEPAEELLQHPFNDVDQKDSEPRLIDHVIVGSGYGACMTALVLALAHRHELESDEASKQTGVASRSSSEAQPWINIGILERGREYLPGDFPKKAGSMPGFVSMVRNGCRLGTADGLWDVRVGDRVSTVTGIGLGGTSLVNANVALRPEPALLQQLPDPPRFGDNDETSWAIALSDYYELAEYILSIAVHPQATQLDKYRALEKIANRIEPEFGCVVKPVPLMVNFGDNASVVAGQPSCINCGNCVSGCNTGAKNSLNLTVLPILRALGVRIFTGVEVLSLEKTADRQPHHRPDWTLHARLTNKPRARFKIAANTVVLSAGSIGSTEILKRSQRDHKLALSSTLGSRFSTNGDSIAFGYGQKEAVNSVAQSGDYSPESEQDVGIGPTIVGTIGIEVAADGAGAEVNQASVSQRFTGNIQDGTIPWSLRSIWSELLCTQALFRRFVDSKPSAWHQAHKNHDPLLASKDLDEHNQTLLLMGADDSTGQLESEGDAGHVVPRWNKISNRRPFLEAINRSLKSVDEETRLQGGFDGGKYLPNPLWRPLPAGFAGFVAGADKLTGHTATVHPLGGCAIGADSRNGVVNRYGQVFDNKDVVTTEQTPLLKNIAVETKRLHRGLYVADGSIVSSPLGTNPALTIAALGLFVGHSIVRRTVPEVETLSELAKQAKRQARGRYTLPTGDTAAQNLVESASADDEKSAEVSGVFEEYLFTMLDPDVPHQPRNYDRQPFKARRFLEVLGLTERVQQFEQEYRDELRIEQTRSDGTGSAIDEGKVSCLALRIIVPELSVTQFLERADTKMRATAQLYLLKHSVVHRVQKECVKDLKPLIEFDCGEVVFGKLYRPKNWLEQHARIYRALKQFWYYRKAEIWVAIAQNLTGEVKSEGSLFDRIKGYYRVAKVHTDWRRIEYKFSKTDENGDTLVFQADKEFAYAPRKQDLWNAMGWLRPKVIRKSRHESLPDQEAEVYFEVDVVSISRGPSPLQIDTTPDLPTTVVRMLSAGSYYLRVVMQTHFWSFGAASYSTFQNKQQLEQWRLQDPPMTMSYQLAGSSARFIARRQDAVFEPSELKARLVRYQPDQKHIRAGAHQRAVLLVHGLGHSSRVYWTDTIEGDKEQINRNFVQVMLSRGHDVWVVDHRTSSSLIADVEPTDTWDDIAKVDIPWAVNYIYDRINVNPQNRECPDRVRVFAHCIGAGAVSMAVLSGLLHRGRVCMIESFAMHAVPPWLYASAENRVRANVYSLVKDWPLFSRLDPVPHSDPNLLEILLDRLGSVYQWNPQQWRGVSDRGRGSEFARKVFNRYRFIWGHEWNNDNVDARTKSEFAKMIGPVPVAILKQVYFSVFRGRLTDEQGTNKYVKAENFQKYWEFPTLFLHGTDNRVFDVESTKLSVELLTRLQKMKVDREVQHMTRMTSDVSEAFRLQTWCNRAEHVGHRVWLKLLAGYGHMDVLFGKKAANDVHAYVADFFEKAQNNLPDQHARSPMAYPRNMRRHAGQNLREQEIRHKRPLLVGPVISHVDDEKISVWAESNDFVTQNPLQFAIVDKKRKVIKIAANNCTNSNVTESDVRDRSNFWLTQVQLGADAPQTDQFPLLPVVRYTEATLADDIKADYVSPELQSLHDSVPELNWHAMPWYRNRFIDRNAPRGKVSLLLGSCLHPGTTFERRKSDEVFRGISVQAGLEENDAGQKICDGADALILLGDTIYADATASLFDPHSHYERFRVRYRTAYGGRYARELLANLPTHFVIDDHEIIDNWQGQNDPEKTVTTGFDKRSLDYQFETALDEAWHFLRRPTGGWVKGHENDRPQLWDEFNVAGFPVFTLDTRTERCSETPRDDCRALISETQMKKFEGWLNQTVEQKAQVIFIGSGSPLATISRSMVRYPALAAWSDDLNGYPGFLRELTRLLASYQHRYSQRHDGSMPTIVWLSGDLHFSLDAQICLRLNPQAQGADERDKKASYLNDIVHIRHISASGLHVPIPFINDDPIDFDWHEGQQLSCDNRSDAPTCNLARDAATAKTDQSSIQAGWTNLGAVQVKTTARFLSASQQHFVRLDCELVDDEAGSMDQPPRITVRAFDRHGEPIA